MNDLFYDSWLLIGLEEHRYAKPYPTIPLSASKAISEHALFQIEPGYWCKYGNRLRNENCYRDFKVPVSKKVTMEKISDSRVEAIFNCEKNILIENADSWIIYDPQKAKKISENDAWSYNGNSFFCVNDKFYAIARKLEEISATGSLLSLTRILLASELRFHDVASIDNNLVLAGFQMNPMPRETGKPFGFLQKIPIDGFSPKSEKTGMREVARSQMIAFYLRRSMAPIYLKDTIVQPLANRIAFFSYNLDVLRVIEGEFDPQFVSAGLNSTIYMSAFMKGSLVLIAFTPEGNEIFKASITRSLGDLVCPPLVSEEGILYIAGMNGIAAFDQTGLHLWTHLFLRQTDGMVFPLLYNKYLSVCFDSKCMIIDSKDHVSLEFDLVDGQARTALIPDAYESYYVGTNKGAYKIH